MAKSKTNRAEPVTAEAAEYAAEFARLEAENAALKAKLEVKQTISFKVGAKGGVSVYGLGRFPVTLYASQWERLLEKADALRVFLAEHDVELARK